MIKTLIDLLLPFSIVGLVVGAVKKEQLAKSIESLGISIEVIAVLYGVFVGVTFLLWCSKKGYLSIKKSNDSRLA